ncbi:hypothetical protein HORIV_01240 [Vreelandella olivaria]|uniref:Flagellar biosynthetic protein FlhB n=2 Tax=Vreelandella TaxID=3137766 RepID=A0ABM7GB92_9GAMM|nr:hypothetical protein HORIV_01240 [Halomonas olivaria]
MGNRPTREVVHESLQSLVRQQLEMLVMPTIRWEGDVWAGIFMALVINLPAREEGAEGKQQEGEPEGGWRSDMQLEVPNLGAFNASLWLYRNVLSIDFTTESTHVYQRIDAGLPALEKRLSALDLQKCSCARVMSKRRRLMATPGERRRQAVALAYQDNDRAPKVVAKGYGELAERIMAEAQRQGIYVHDAPELVALLMQLDLDAEIPASLYQIVAELLVWVFELSEEGLTHREMPE